MEICEEALLILISGAGGGLGRYVLAELEDKGRPGLAVVRSAVKIPKGKISFHKGDLRNKKWLETLFRDFSIQKVVHLAWERKGLRSRLRGEGAENIQVTRILLELCQQHQVPSFIFASSLNAGLPVKNHYAREKEETEKLIKSFDIQQKVIYRLSTLFGTGIQAYWNDLTRSALKKRMVFLMGEKPLHFQPLYAGEAARIILEERAEGTYYLVGPEIWTDEDLVRFVQGMRYLRIRILRIPIKTMALILNPWTSLVRPLALIQKELKALNQDKIYLGPEALTGCCRFGDYLKELTDQGLGTN